MPGRKSYAGAASALTLAGGITDTDLSFTTTTPTNWPTGTGAQPFVIVIDRGTNDEEKLLISARSGTAFTVSASGRGYDGTSQVAHTLGASVEHCLDADTLTEANAHVNDDSRDDHSQYLNTTRHAAVSHLIGTHLPTPPAPAAVSTSASAGSSTSAARADHVHILGSGAVSSAAMIANDIITSTQIAANAIGSSELANNAVDSGAIANDAVTELKILDGEVKFNKIANDAVRSQHIQDAAINDDNMIDDGTLSDERLFSNDIRPVMVGTDAAKPATAGTGRVTGQHYYETDNLRTVVWDGTKWASLAPTIVGGVELVDHTMTALSSYQLWDAAQVITVPTTEDYSVKVDFAGQFNATASLNHFAVTNLGISFDGGSTWTNQDEAKSPGATFTVASASFFFANSFALTDSATSTIQVRIRVFQSAGTFGVAAAGKLTWVVAPV